MNGTPCITRRDSLLFSKNRYVCADEYFAGIRLGLGGRLVVGPGASLVLQPNCCRPRYEFIFTAHGAGASIGRLPSLGSCQTSSENRSIILLNVLVVWFWCGFGATKKSTFLPLTYYATILLTNEETFLSSREKIYYDAANSA